MRDVHPLPRVVLTASVSPADLNSPGRIELNSEALQMNTHLPATPRAHAPRLALALLFAGALVFAPLAPAAAQAAAPQQQPAPAAAPALPAGVERVTSVEGITEYRLRS